MKRATIAILVLMTACSGGSSLTLEKAIIGHWATEDGKLHDYFSAGKRTIIVEGETRGPNTYTIKSIDDNANKLIIEIFMESSPASFAESYVFSADKKEMLEEAVSIAGFAVTQPRRWRYVDNKESP